MSAADVSATMPVWRSLSSAEIVDGLVGGDRAILARAITLVESSRAADSELALRIVEDCLPAAGNSVRVGITGAPGVGKSSVIEALGVHLTAECGESVAVLAIDPSSEIAGGSILGDKTRMARLAASGKAFIRPSPSRGYPGGVSEHTREAIVLCEAAGFRNVLVETVGVGQSEIAVHDVVDFVLLILLAGAGDELQGIKRGIMEFAHLVAINKADGENATRSEAARLEAEQALHFFPPSPPGWNPRAIACSALTGRGIAELWDCVLAQTSAARACGWMEQNRREQNRRGMHICLERGVRRQLMANAEIRERMASLELEVLEGHTSPARAATTLLDAYAAECANSSAKIDGLRRPG